jgi:hypothetical protein
MQVMAFSTPTRPEWRWRITDYSGQMIEESRDSFASISAAVAAGTAELVRMSAPDRSHMAPPTWRVRQGGSFAPSRRS